MSQTLQSYITAVRYLLHDANANFYTDSQLTDYINGARERIVRDTGCLRTVQISQTPCTPVAGGANPYIWAAGAVVNTNDYVFSNIFIYKVVTGGILGSIPQAHRLQTARLRCNTQGHARSLTTLACRKGCTH